MVIDNISSELINGKELFEGDIINLHLLPFGINSFENISKLTFIDCAFNGN